MPFFSADVAFRGRCYNRDGLYLGGKMQENSNEKWGNLSEKDILKRVEILGEAVQTALEALLEIQAEQKLLTYILTKRAKDKEE